MNDSLEEILEVIKKSHRILITAHVSPDGDSIGSGLALLLSLNKFNEKLKNTAKKNGDIYIDKTLRFILEDKVPKNLRFLPHSCLVEESAYFDSKYDFDLVICLDCGDFNRIGDVNDLFFSDTTIINIDHHISNNRFGTYNYLVTSASSTSELVFKFLSDSNLPIDKDIASGLYTGLINDTGNFKHSNTTKEVFEMAKQLLDYGVKPNEIVRKFLDTKSMARLKLTGHVLSGCKFVDNLKLVYYYISEAELEELGASKSDSDGLVEQLLTYEEANVALILKEDRGVIKGSFRSKGNVNVNKIAALFGGGGHVNAAGFKTKKTVSDTLEIIREKIGEEEE